MRGISTVKTTYEHEQELLIAQRKNRPCSPHLTIYTPQITMILSSLHRITGVAMGGAFYAVTIAYAATSILNIPFDSNTLVSYFTELPVTLQYGVKAAMAYPFFFHFGNGLRHLLWDTGKELTIKGVYRTGYIVSAVSVALATYWTFF